jgi:hypothetical protein
MILGLFMHQSVWLFVGVLIAVSAGSARVEAEPSAAARNVVQEIRREALLPPNAPAGRPLPLVSHWNMGSQGKGWTPQYQRELLDQGHHILPWFGWPQSNPLDKQDSAKRFHEYYDGLMGYCRELDLPISFRGTQWEAMLYEERYLVLPPEQCPAVVTPEGKAIPKLDPFGAVEPWRDPAKAGACSDAVRRFLICPYGHTTNGLDSRVCGNDIRMGLRPYSYIVGDAKE